jgi:hypothetical protein
MKLLQSLKYGTTLFFIHVMNILILFPFIFSHWILHIKFFVPLSDILLLIVAKRAQEVERNAGYGFPGTKCI